MRILLFQGSPRAEDNCPNQAGKTLQLAHHIQNNAPPDVEFDFCDLALRGGPVTQPCKGCVSTAGGFHCHWPCDCYRKGSDKAPDFLHDNDIYARLQACDGFMVLTPVHWYGPTTVVKAIFDRLVCANLTLTVDQSRALGLGKDAEKTRAAEKNGQHKHMLKNHLEGKVAAFYAHGDNGGADYKELSGEAPLPFPESLREHMLSTNSPEGRSNDPREAIMPLVWQCRYSGIFAPDELAVGMHINAGLNHAEAMDATARRDEFFKAGVTLLEGLVSYVRKQQNRSAPV